MVISKSSLSERRSCSSYTHQKIMIRVLLKVCVFAITLNNTFPWVRAIKLESVSVETHSTKETTQTVTSEQCSEDYGVEQE